MLVFLFVKTQTIFGQNDTLSDKFTSQAKNKMSKIYRGGFSRHLDQALFNKTHLIMHQVFIYQLY